MYIVSPRATTKKKPQKYNESHKRNENIPLKNTHLIQKKVKQEDQRNKTHETCSKHKTDVNPNISIITLKMNRFNILTKGREYQIINYMLSISNMLHVQRNSLKLKG